MKHTGLKKLIFLTIALGLVCALIPVQALTIDELPAPVELNADAEAPSFQMTGLNGTTISSSELDGKPAILLFGRTTCFNCNYFMKGIKDALPLLQQLHSLSSLSGIKTTICGISPPARMTAMNRSVPSRPRRCSWPARRRPRVRPRSIWPSARL